MRQFRKLHLSEPELKTKQRRFRTGGVGAKDGEVVEVDANHISLIKKHPVGAKKTISKREYILQTFEKSNAFTSHEPGAACGKRSDDEEGQTFG